MLSRSTKTRDMVYKLNTFMTSGVSEYWIVDTADQRITVYNFKDLQIEKMEVYKEGEVARSICFEGLDADVRLLFDDMP